MTGTPRIVLAAVAAVAAGVLLVGTLLLGSSSGSVTPQPRNWSDVLRQDPAINVVACPSGGQPPIGAEVCIATMPAFGAAPAISDPVQTGFVDPDVLYGDLDGDGIAEAVLSIWSGGAAS